MTNKYRLLQLEKRTAIKHPGKITVEIIGDDPDDPNYLIIDQYGPKPRRVSKADHDAKIKALEDTGETVIIVD